MAINKFYNLFLQMLVNVCLSEFLHVTQSHLSQVFNCQQDQQHQCSVTKDI